MKRLTLILLLAFTSIVHGQALVDLTPGGYGDQLPPVLVRIPWAQLHFFDQAKQGLFWADPKGWEYLNGWESGYANRAHPFYGDLKGGGFFSTNLFALNATPTAAVWWNFVGTQRFSLGLILVWGRRSNGTVWQHLYWVREPLAGISQVTVDGQTPIMGIIFYGFER